MAHVKIYGRRDVWQDRRGSVSDAIHRAIVGTWGLRRAGSVEDLWDAADARCDHWDACGCGLQDDVGQRLGPRGDDQQASERKRMTGGLVTGKSDGVAQPARGSWSACPSGPSPTTVAVTWRPDALI